jgi:hypothetical protein
MITPISSVFYNITAIDSIYSQSELNAKEPTENVVVKEDDYSPFYRSLIKKYEMLFPGSNDDYLLATCKAKQNHGKKVSTYRITIKNGDLVPVDGDNEVKMPEEALESILTNLERSSNRQSLNKGVKRIFKTTIKTKGYLIKLLSSLPLPLMFTATLIISLLCAMIASAAGVVEYLAYDNLYNKVGLQMTIIKVQTETLNDLLRISIAVLCGIGYSK